ncbi:MAG: hypothetical protein J6Y77_00420 [Paludibacteraceae bacterium]|nr:hypothetical protein [Paludibacteraceae bacterium]
MNNAYKVILGALACCLAWMCYDSIMTPIRFGRIQEEREAVIISRMKDIREAEKEFRKIKGHYTDDFDSLIQFVTTEKDIIIRKEGELTDKQLEEGLTERKAVALGLIRRDTSYVSIQEKLFGANYPVDSLRYIPFSDGELFEMEVGETTDKGGNIIKLMECRADCKVYLGDLNKQELANFIEEQNKLERYAGLKFGDVNSPNNNAGNWE